MTKKEARSIYKERRLSLTVTQRDKMEDLILIEFQKLAKAIPNIIMTYAANGKLLEYDPSLVERYCNFRNPMATFVYPRIEEDGLHAIAINDNTTFTTNRFGIDEPEGGSLVDACAIDLIFVPLLAFDKKGFRVGYGKGYYDKFLSVARVDTLKIGFSFFDAEDSIDDINEFDIALDICITPFKTYYFNQSSC